MLRFFFEFCNHIVRIRIHNAEPAGFLRTNLYDRNGSIRPAADMMLEHEAIIHFIDVVARQDQYIIRIVLF